MKNRTNQFTIASGPSESIKLLRIPIYQRPYSWGPEQISKLVSDFIQCYYNDEKNPYYLGTISLIEINDENFHDVLDGQQRLTTLFLLTAWLKNKTKCIVFDNFLLYKNNPRLEFQTRANLKKSFSLFINSEEFGNESNLSNFKDAINIFELKLNNSSIDLNLFSNWLSSSVTLFTALVPLESDKDPESRKPQSLYKYYDAVNTSGLQLEKIDLLKAKLLELLNKGRVHSEIFSTAFVAAFNPYEDISLDFVKKINDTSIEKKSLLNTEISEFKIEYITLKEALEQEFIADNIPLNKISPDYDRHVIAINWDLAVLTWHVFNKTKEGKWNNVSVFDIESDVNSDSKAIEFIKILVKVRFSLDNFFIRPVDSRIPDIKSINLSFLDKIEISEDEDDAEVNVLSKDKNIFNKQDVSLLQQALNGSTLEKHQWLCGAILYLIGNENCSWNDFYIALEKAERERAMNYFPEGTFTNELKFGKPYVAYYLNMIDFILAQRNSNYKLKMQFTSRNSVEHIIAQNSLDPEGKFDKTIPEGFKDSVYNLALLTSSRNSTYQNNYFVDKRKIFENYQDKMGFIESFRLYEIYKLNGDIVEDIKKVGEDHDHLFQAWLYPKNTDSLLQP